MNLSRKKVYILKKKVRKQQESKSFKAERPNLSCLDGHGESMSTRSLLFFTQTRLHFKHASKWTNDRGVLGTLWHILRAAASQIPPYVTLLFVHRVSNQTEQSRRREIGCSGCQILQDISLSGGAYYLGLPYQHNYVWNSRRRLLSKACWNTEEAIRRGLCHEISIWILWKRLLPGILKQKVLFILIRNPSGFN